MRMNRGDERGGAMKTAMKTIVAGCGVALAAAAVTFLSPVTAQQSRVGPGGTVMSFYDLETMTLADMPADLDRYRGTVSLVVNVASKCAYTPQYEGLEQLQRGHGRDRLRDRLRTVEKERRRLLISEEEQFRPLHDRLLTLLNRHNQLQI